jgi:Spy/CpxP family protein refolding chaperone
MKHRHVLTSLAGLAFVGALLVPVAGFAGKGKHKGHAKLDRLCEQIACTEAQATGIEQVFEQLHADIKPDREAIRELRQQLATEWKTDRPDELELAKLAEQVAAHERNVADRRMEAMLELHALLTPGQREQLADHLLKLGHRERG